MLLDQPFSDLIIYPGGALLKGGGFPTRHLEDQAQGEVDHILAKVKAVRALTAEKLACSVEQTKSFRCLIGGNLFRVSVYTGLDGEQYTLRKIDRELRSFAQLNIPQRVSAKLLGISGGLILFSGKMGVGKTTTAAAYMKAYLEAQPRTGITIEDPPEKLLQGRFGKDSQCLQSEVPYERFQEAITDVLRHHPDILFLGELRERHAVLEALNAASTGHVIVSTIHAGSPIETITRVIGRCAEVIGMDNSRFLLADGLAAIVHQSLVFTNQRYLPHFSPLWVAGCQEEISIRSIIREGSLTSLHDKMFFQAKNG